jgi:hypothetical protein
MLSVLAFWENWERQGARDGSWEVGLNLGWAEIYVTTSLLCILFFFFSAHAAFYVCPRSDAPCWRAYWAERWVTLG